MRNTWIHYPSCKETKTPIRRVRTNFWRDEFFTRSTPFARNRANSVADCSVVCRSKTCTVPRVPCKPKADPWKFLSVRKIVWNSVNGVKISYSRILETKLNWVHETNIVNTATVGLECRYVLMRNDRKVMVDLEPGEHMKKMFLQSVTQATRKKKNKNCQKQSNLWHPLYFQEQ